MENNKTQDDIKIHLAVNEYFGSQIRKGVISPFCAMFYKILIMKSIALESKNSPLKINNVMQLKKWNIYL